MNSIPNSVVPFIDYKGHEMKNLELGVKYTMTPRKDFILVLSDDQLIEGKINR